MSNESIVLRGMVLPDGSVQVTGTVQLPPGPVEVVVQPVAPEIKREGILEFLERIRAEQKASGHKPRTAEEIDAYVREMRDEWEERQTAIEALQEEGRRRREGLPSSEAP